MYCVKHIVLLGIEEPIQNKA